MLTKLIAPHLGEREIDLHVPIVRIGRKSRGGVRYLQADDLFDQLRRFLKDRRQPYVTTMFDYYAFPTGGSKGWKFAGEVKAEAGFRGAENVAKLIEGEIQSRALEGIDLPNAKARLIPYVQVHEMEALFFAEPEKMCKAFGEPDLVKEFARIVEECDGCERINDNPQTAPSKRIEAAFPRYRKGRSDLVHGPRIAEKLDLRIVRSKCPRFNAWLARLETL